uniref:AAA domain-containing protein n=1 Tax=Globodera pallida TaxID=36090 RepID=A0A183BJK6_GLOPA
MEYLDDDAFGALAYEEEEFEQDLQTKTHPQKGSDEILPELSDDDEDIELAAVDSAKENHQQQNVQPEEHMARKRGPIGVFNDYSPIDWHMRIGDEEGQAKRRRLELEEAVGRATMRILAARTAARRQQQQQQRRPNDAATGDDILGKTSSLPQTTRKNKLLRVPPMNGQIWWGINSVDGTFRRYLSTRRHQDRESALAKFAVQLADDDASLAKLVLAEERVHEREQQHNQSPLKDDVDVQMVDVDLTKKVKKGPSTSALWTDKYAPRTFLDLLTEDETNRTVLLWLRLWDKFVFGNRGHKGMGHDSNRKSSNNSASSLWDTLEERDKTFFEMERPKGTETTMNRFGHFLDRPVWERSSLARVAALQAGYSPVIIPISEFQNVAELKSRLENATDSTSIDALFHNLAIASSSEAAVGTRPCCFIVDAVEQASSEMVQFLCSWVRRSRISSSSTAATIRRRPVICTCASLWNAPSLRELRVNCMPVRLWADGGGGQEQRQLIQRVVELMRSFRIGLVRTTGADGMARFTFEPAFHSLVRFPVQSLPSANESRTVAFSAQLISEPVKQYIAHQLERAPAKMGRDECEDVSGSKDHANPIQQHWTAGPRPASPSSSPSSSSFSANAPLFTYQHSAGSSQAVRREIRIGTLFSAFQH